MAHGEIPTSATSLRTKSWKLEDGERLVVEILYLALLTYRLSAPDLESLVKRLKIASEEAALLRQVNRLLFSTSELVKERRPSAIYRLLKHYSGAAIFVLWIATDSESVRERLELHHRTLRFVEPEIDGEYLKAMGLKPSPLFGQILSALRDARLDGEVSSLEEEKALVDELLDESGTNRS